MHQAGGKANCSEHHADRESSAHRLNFFVQMTLHRRSRHPCAAALWSFSIDVVAGALLAAVTKRRWIYVRSEGSDGDSTAELQDAEAEMESVLQSIFVRCLADPAEHSEQAYKLSKAQKAWVAYRDAHIAAIYPEGGEHGPVAELRKASILADLTRERTRQMREWWE